MTRLRLSYSKYGNVKQEEDGYTFDSTAERNRYRMLKVMARNQDIYDLTVHPSYDLIMYDKKVGTYVADFTYREGPNGSLIMEDVKGVRTALFSLKAKMMKAQYGIVIREVDQYGNPRERKRRRKERA